MAIKVKLDLVKISAETEIIRGEKECWSTRSNNCNALKICDCISAYAQTKSAIFTTIYSSPAI
jgi:hypothetical protein